MEFSVIIPAKDAQDTLDACLAALKAQTLEENRYEVILIDDGSQDATAEIGRSYGVRVFSQPNRGPAAARNQGAELAEGEILIFTDADCEPSPDFLEKMVQPFQDPEVAGAMGTYRSKEAGWVPRFVQSEFDYKQALMRQRSQINTVHTYAGAYRRELFLQHQGFDEHYPIPSNEDQEFSYRMAKQGYWLVFAPEACVYHPHDRTLGEYLGRKFFLGFWKAYTLFRHPQQIKGDTHTPFTQLLQIGIVLPLFSSFVLGLLFPFWRWFGLLCSLTFLASMIPFGFHLARHQPMLLWRLPAMVLLQALAQALGLVLGSLRVLLRGAPSERTMS